jgi:hypothetical protein
VRRTRAHMPRRPNKTSEKTQGSGVQVTGSSRIRRPRSYLVLQYPPAREGGEEAAFCFGRGDFRGQPEVRRQRSLDC